MNLKDATMEKSRTGRVMTSIRAWFGIAIEGRLNDSHEF